MGAEAVADEATAAEAMAAEAMAAEDVGSGGQGRKKDELLLREEESREEELSGSRHVHRWSSGSSSSKTNTNTNSNTITNTNSATRSNSNSRSTLSNSQKITTANKSENNEANGVSSISENTSGKVDSSDKLSVGSIFWDGSSPGDANNSCGSLNHTVKSCGLLKTSASFDVVQQQKDDSGNHDLPTKMKKNNVNDNIITNNTSISSSKPSISSSKPSISSGKPSISSGKPSISSSKPGISSSPTIAGISSPTIATCSTAPIVRSAMASKQYKEIMMTNDDDIGFNADNNMSSPKDVLAPTEMSPPDMITPPTTTTNTNSNTMIAPTTIVSPTIADDVLEPSSDAGCDTPAWGSCRSPEILFPLQNNRASKNNCASFKTMITEATILGSSIPLDCSTESLTDLVDFEGMNSGVVRIDVEENLTISDVNPDVINPNVNPNDEKLFNNEVSNDFNDEMVNNDERIKSYEKKSSKEHEHLIPKNDYSPPLKKFRSNTNAINSNTNTNSINSTVSPDMILAPSPDVYLTGRVRVPGSLPKVTVRDGDVDDDVVSDLCSVLRQSSVNQISSTNNSSNISFPMIDEEAMSINEAMSIKKRNSNSSGGSKDTVVEEVRISTTEVRIPATVTASHSGGGRW